VDEAILFAVNGVRSPALDPVASFLTDWGLYAFPLALLAVFAAQRTKDRGRQLRDGWLAFLLSLFVSESIVKPLVHRARPSSVEALAERLHVLGSAPSSSGFPSGTATACAAGATWIAIQFGWRAGVAAWAFAVLVSLTRLYAGVHWPTDLLAGWAVGALVAIGVDRFSRWASDAAPRLS
jgi:undecaprenyl-diphosphatase